MIHPILHLVIYYENMRAVKYFIKTVIIEPVGYGYFLW